MATIAIFAQGTKLQMDSGGGLATIVDVKSITGPTLTRDIIDVTSHSSSSGFREFINGLKDGGTVTFDINFDPVEATHKNAAGGLLESYVSGDVESWKIIFPDPALTEWTFSGVIQDFQTSMGIDDALSASVTVKVTGAPVLA